MIKTIQIMFAVGALAIAASTFTVANAANHMKSCGGSGTTSMHKSECSKLARHHHMRRHHMRMHKPMMKKY